MCCFCWKINFRIYCECIRKNIHTICCFTAFSAGKFSFWCFFLCVRCIWSYEIKRVNFSLSSSRSSSSRVESEQNKLFFCGGVKNFFQTELKSLCLTFFFKLSDFLNSHHYVNVLGYHFEALMFTFFASSFSPCKSTHFFILGWLKSGKVAAV